MHQRLSRAGKLAWAHFFVAAAIVLIAEHADAIRSPEMWPALSCAERQPAPAVRVYADIGTRPQYEQASSSALRNLTQGHGMVAPGAVLGLTSAVLDSRIHVRLQGQPLVNGRLCASPEYEIGLTLDRFRVYLATELNQDACARSFVMNHESLHVLVYQEALQKTRSMLELELRQAAVNYEIDREGLDDLRERLRKLVVNRIKNLFEGFNAEHLRIDTPQEYDRAFKACNGVIPRLVGAGQQAPVYPVRFGRPP